MIKKTFYLKTSSNRSKFVLAVIFLLALALTWRLFNLQILKHQVYLQAANDQHRLEAVLEPTRGKIIAQDKTGKTYPLAANKTFVEIFAIPGKVKEPQAVMDLLYQFFKQTAVTEEVNKQLEVESRERLRQELNYVNSLDLAETDNTERLRQVNSWFADYLRDPLYLQSRNERAQLLEEEKKMAIYAAWQTIFNKTNDPYESLEKKVEPDLAKQFHLALLNKTDVDLQKLEFIKNTVYLKSDDQPGQEQSTPLDYLGIGYLTEDYRYYVEKNIGAHLLGFTDQQKSENSSGFYGRHGHYGLEGFFDQELFGQYGQIKGERGGTGLLIANNGEFISSVPGSDLFLTIDHTLQFYACQQLNVKTELYQADNASLIVMEPTTGAILAICGAPDFDPNNYEQVEEVSTFNNPALFDQYEPGSVFKAITMAAALDQNKITPTTTYYDEGQVKVEGWPKPIKNYDFNGRNSRGTQTMTQVLENSLNTGAIFAAQQLEPQIFAGYIQKFGFGEKTGIELEGEYPGNIKKLLIAKPKIVDIATASFGQGALTVTPLQMITAYAALINGGYLVKPRLVQTLVKANGEKLEIGSSTSQQQVIKPETSQLISSMLVSVVENGHSQGNKIPGYYVGGKTGTAQIAATGKSGYLENKFNHTFIGFAPLKQPRLVVLVKFKDPKGYRYADATAAPLVKDVLNFALNYWEVPQDKP